MWTAKTLVRLGGCPGWSESLLGAHAILLVLSWGCSFLFYLQQGAALIQDEHPSSPEIQKTLKDLNAQWKDLYEKSMDKGHKLRQAADQHSLNKALADAQVKCHLKEILGWDSGDRDMGHEVVDYMSHLSIFPQSRFRNSCVNMLFGLRVFNVQFCSKTK